MLEAKGVRPRLVSCTWVSSGIGLVPLRVQCALKHGLVEVAGCGNVCTSEGSAWYDRLAGCDVEDIALSGRVSVHKGQCDV